LEIIIIGGVLYDIKGSSLKNQQKSKQSAEKSINIKTVDILLFSKIVYGVSNPHPHTYYRGAHAIVK